MTEITLEEASSSENSSTMAQRSISNLRQPTGTPTDIQVPPITPPVVSLSNLNIGARTMERSRLIVNNISTTIEEIQPFIEQARLRPGISLTSWLNLQRQTPEERTPATHQQQPRDSYVIDLETPLESEPASSQNSPTDHNHHHNTTSTDNYLNNIREAANAENQNNNNDSQENLTGVRSAMNPEARKMLKILQKYVPFLLILLVKSIYDYRAGIVHFIVLLVTTIQADTDLKREIAKQHSRNHMALLGIILYIIGCIVFVDFVFDQPIFLRFATPTSAWELLWSVAITDFMLKLITMVLKVILTCLPAKIVALQTRGKYYLMVEATSQLYRCCAPIQPWLYYLFEAYHGPEKIFGICLSAAYSISKASDLLSRGKLFKHAVHKLMQQVSVGSYASKDQLVESGGICAICHDEYSTPVRLHCKHIFCELCVITWLDRERSCPLCRAPVTDNPIYRDGHTTHFIQLY